jgi:hypothetical protein
MGRTLTSWSGVVATRGKPEVVHATSRDVDLLRGWYPAAHSPETITSAVRHSPLNGLAQPQSTLPDQSHSEGRAVTDAARSTKIALRLALIGFRTLLSLGWRPDTAYPETVTPPHWSAGNPRGQCGVSSVWLAAVLNREYSICPTFCRGALVFVDQQAENVLDHCWLEIEEQSGEQLILDLTCDQAQGFNRQIILDSRADLDQENVHYIPRERVDISDLPNNPVWPRYQMLLDNMTP